MTILNSGVNAARFACLLMLSPLLLGLSSCHPPAPRSIEKPNPVILLILVDVTKSLEASEVQQVAALAADVLDRFPPHTDYVVYPIQRETERPTTIDESHPKEPYVARKDDEKAQRRVRLRETIGRHYEEVNKDQKQPVDRTCILNTLNLAAKHFHETTARFSVEAAKTACMELVIISDMIEHCRHSPDVLIDLQKPIAKNLELAGSISTIPNLSAIKISIIIPTAESSTPFAQNRPRLADLEAFWNSIFLRAGFDENRLREFNWLPTLPGRFERVCESQTTLDLFLAGRTKHSSRS